MLEKPLILLVRIYQRGISPFIKPRCKYYPTCSAYAISSLKIHGLFKGLCLIIWRLLRCNPYSNGGVDYSPRVGEWKAAPYHQMSDEELKNHWKRIEIEKNRSTDPGLNACSGTTEEKTKENQYGLV